MPTVLVDSNLWFHALTEPRDESHRDLHASAEQFLRTVLTDPQVVVALSVYQIAEILDLLRKAGVPQLRRDALAEDLRSPKFVLREIPVATVFECFRLSAQSGIHIYDYLVAVPLRGIADRIYSGDDHFQHPHFTAIAPVENPVAPWHLREGTRPTRG